ncbi:alpha/beta hydrolase-fold protein [Clostridium sp. AL.422]|uniref:alpha/beta hydrolase n=1 Tax=Clostridium TaxID=1485 RepID=UPI00293DDFC1|nr:MULTISPECIES: alpha/beta hydrolase-fold protein [unclassified Clostridium]MDV4151160.1 alpha/beta hydrolase-fold protein [Clostridium sp. AL.422]
MGNDNNEIIKDSLKDKEFKVLPAEYRIENKKQGTIESLEYKVENLKMCNNIKHLNLYLPYGYKATDKNKKYNVLYLMHGGGEDENLLFGGPGKNTELKNILDNMIANGDIQPLIVVTPTFYGVKNDLKNDEKLSHVEILDHPLPIVETQYFHDELINDLIPFVETKYNTYTASDNKEDLKATREHRAFGGFSMGSVTTWYAFINCLDYFKYFIPLSGDCWALAQKAEGNMAKETAEYLAKVAKDSGYTPKEYYLLCASGDLDIAYPNMRPQIDALRELKDSFIYSSDLKEGNFYFIVGHGGIHNWHWINQFIYNILPDLFN